MSIPIFDAQLRDMEDGIFAISLVSEPAVEKDFIAFKKDEKPEFKFEVENEPQHMITGVIMLADTPIYRWSPEMGEYYIKFSREVIKQMAEKMLQVGSHNAIDLQHDEYYFFDKCNLVECFIKDSEKGINHNAFTDIPDGSLLATYKVHDDRLWKQIMDGEVKGFSLEGLFSMGEAHLKKEEKQDTIMNKIKSILSKLLAEFASVKAEDGTELFYEGEEIAVGTEVADADGNAIADGEYIVEEKTIVVADGKVTEIKEKEEETEDPEVEEETKEETVEAEEEPVEEPEPVQEPEEPAKDYDAEIEALRAEIEALKAEIEAIKNTLAEPAVEPVAEEFEKAKGNKATGNKGLERALAIAGALKN